MSQNYTDNSTTVFTGYINNAIKQAIADEYDKAIEEATKRAIERRDEVVSSVALQMSRSMDINTLSNRITITIDKSKLEDGGK